MKSMLTAFAAIAALAVPAGLPTLASAQELTADVPSPSDMARFQPDESASPIQPAFQAQAERPEVQQVQDRRGGGRGEGGGRGDRGGGGDRGGNGGGWSGGQNNGGGDRGGNRGDRGGWNRGGNDGGGRGDRGPGQGGDPRWNQPNPTPPVITPPSQDGGGRDRDRGSGGWDRGNNGQNNGGWNGGQNGGGRDRDRDRGNGGDNRGQDWNRGNDGRDRNNGGWNGGGQNNGGWDRDRNNGGRNWQSDRNGRRNYNGWNGRWNQNDWRRDWNRGRSNDWWRNDRGFRGYSGYRFGFYFAPNYGYYSVPRNYWGQRWYAGDYLPSIFWRYQLNDYRTYGLGYPPPGTQWVAVDTTIYLIDSFDGYIIEVIYDAWRW